MKILAPISKVYEVEDVIKAGADEVYCGVYTKEWRKICTSLASPNRRAGRSANLDSFKELCRIVKLSHSHNIPVSFTMNEFYSEEQYDLVMDNINQAVEAGVDSLTVVDLNILLMIKEKKYSTKIHMGTGGTTFNSRTVDFYKGLGVSRVILDRQLNVEEIGAIASRSAGMELVVFVLNQKCHNIDGFCTFQHGLMAAKYPFLSNALNAKPIKRLLDLYPGDATWLEEAIFRKALGCCLDYEISESGLEFNPERRAELLRFFYVGNFLDRCGACALYDLNKFKVGFVKIVGREDLFAKKIRDIKFIRGSRDLLKENLEKRDFIEKVKALYKDVYSSACNSNFCYYQKPS